MAGFLLGLRAKGETVDEIVGRARDRARSAPFPGARHGLVDTCGTGGDGAGTFNISTTAAFIAAGAGVPVAKHGNRAVSSATGSADVLEAIGVDVEMDGREASDALDAVGITFLFAPVYHAAMRHAARSMEIAELAVSERADVIVVAGDVFDSRNPSAAAEEAVYDFFLRNKRQEWMEYKTHVTTFELERYLPRL